ncbi:vacuolar membrane protein-domain-containing protein [Syncephalis fuscata]|nr:vacuolar membrane protein-domain-containing protein [Syncephalis fuscata]
MHEPVIAIPIRTNYTEGLPYDATGLGDPGSIDCKLTDGFAIGVQLVMGLIVCSSLLVKRHREYPQRPLVIWFFDVSKQAAGGIMLHTLNLVGSLFTGSDATDSGNTNPCVWYFLNILLDTTAGAIRLGVPDMRSGYYGHPPRIVAWLRQLVVFVMALASMKLLVLVVLRIFPFFFWFGKWALAPVEAIGDTRVQVVVVMLIFPLIMNIIQFWLVDGVIKGDGRLRSKNYTHLSGEDDAGNYDEGEEAIVNKHRFDGRISRTGTPGSDNSYTGLLERDTDATVIDIHVEPNDSVLYSLGDKNEVGKFGTNSSATARIRAPGYTRRNNSSGSSSEGSASSSPSVICDSDIQEEKVVHFI